MIHLTAATKVAIAIGGALFLHQRAKAKAAQGQAPHPAGPSAHGPAHRVTIPKNERRVPLVVQGIDGAGFAAGGEAGGASGGDVGGA
jgi:hypothetical protein